jgi:hypothetical protein
MVTGLSLLLLLPLVVYQIAKRVHPNRTWAATGLSFGLIIAPASLSLYTFYFASYLGFLPGMVGLLSSFVHGVPGFEIATALRLRNVDTIVSDQEGFIIEIINGLFWGIVYGTLGHLLDRWHGPRDTDKLSNYQGSGI